MVCYVILFMLKIPVMIYRNDECLMNCNSVFNLRTKKVDFLGCMCTILYVTNT